MNSAHMASSASSTYSVTSSQSHSPAESATSSIPSSPFTHSDGTDYLGDMDVHESKIGTAITTNSVLPAPPSPLRSRPPSPTSSAPTAVAATAADAAGAGLTTALKLGEKSTLSQRRGLSKENSESVPPATDEKKKKEKPTLTEKRGIRWAPIKIPLSRRLETAAVIWHAFAVIVFTTIFWWSCGLPLYWPGTTKHLLLIAPYLLHLLFSPTAGNGASPVIRSRYLRALPLWKYYTNYYPINFHRTVPLDPKKNYIFGYSPHGIISMGAWGCFAVDDGVQGPLPDEETYGKLGEGTRDSRPGYMKAPGGSFGRLFPGITNTLLTLEGNFNIPLHREYLAAMGTASVSRRSCEALLRGDYKQPLTSLCKEPFAPTTTSLSKWNPIRWVAIFFRILAGLAHPIIASLKHRKPHRSAAAKLAASTGNAITIVLGGARESLLSFPDTMRVILYSRRGFLKLAIRQGTNTAVVPVLAFGENDIYDQMKPSEGGFIWKYQRFVKRTMGFTVPLFFARGVFNYDVGLLPYRRNIDVVVGKPIFPKCQNDNPTKEEIDELQAEYIAELQRLWDEWKDELAKGRKMELEIVE